MRPGPGLCICGLIAMAGCSSEGADNKVQAYRRQQATDLVAGYEQARSQGDRLTMCVKGNQVSAAYRDAKDPPDAEAWKSKAVDDCRLASNALAPDVRGSNRSPR